MKKLPYFLLEKVSLLNVFFKKYKMYQLIFAIIFFLLIIYLHMQLYQVSEFRMFFDSFYPYILKIIQSINIPIAIIILAIIFRSPISQLINNNWEIDYEQKKIRINNAVGNLVEESINNLIKTLGESRNTSENNIKTDGHDEKNDKDVIENNNKIKTEKNGKVETDNLNDLLKIWQVVDNSKTDFYKNYNITKHISSKSLRKNFKRISNSAELAKISNMQINLSKFSNDFFENLNVNKNQALKRKFASAVSAYANSDYDKAVDRAWDTLTLYFILKLDQENMLETTNNLLLISDFIIKFNIETDVQDLIFKAYEIVEKADIQNNSDMFNEFSSYQYLLSILTIIDSIEKNK